MHYDYKSRYPPVKVFVMKEVIFVFSVKTCGQPKINNVMRNLTLNPGDSAR